MVGFWLLSPYTLRTQTCHQQIHESQHACQWFHWWKTQDAVLMHKSWTLWLIPPTVSCKKKHAPAEPICKGTPLPLPPSLSGQWYSVGSVFIPVSLNSRRKQAALEPNPWVPVFHKWQQAKAINLQNIQIINIVSSKKSLRCSFLFTLGVEITT